MGNLGLAELLVILAVALLVIGPRRLPEVARGMGQAMRAFQDAMNPVQSSERTRSNRSKSMESRSNRRTVVRTWA